MEHTSIVKEKEILNDMGCNGMNSGRIASKGCRSVDFGISDVSIQSLLLRLSSDP